MKRILGSFFVFAMIFVLAFSVSAAPKIGITIQDGILKYSAGHYLAGQLLKTGFDIFGYNYQAHEYGYDSYVNVYIGRDGLPPYDGNDAEYLALYPQVATKWYWPYRNDQVAMKWNDAWLSNMDRDGDGKLDRHYGFVSYIGSGAWLTNHMRGVNLDGTKWTYFVKIIAAPSDATKSGGIWYTSDDVEIGPEIWGSFVVIQEINSGTTPNYVSPSGPGLGKW